MLHVWEAWQTDALGPTVILAAVMNDIDQVMIADQREPVEVNLGENVTIPITNLGNYPMQIKPVSSVKFLDEGERRRSWLNKRIGVPPRSYPVSHLDLMFHVNGYIFNSVDNSEEKKGQELPYCSVGGWDFGSAADQLADFLGIIPLANVALGNGKLPVGPAYFLPCSNVLTKSESTAVLLRSVLIAVTRSWSSTSYLYIIYDSHI